jgi:hypothetical protein
MMVFSLLWLLLISSSLFMIVSTRGFNYPKSWQAQPFQVREATCQIVIHSVRNEWTKKVFDQKWRQNRLFLQTTVE